VAADAGWLLVSKPLRPPFRDGSTVMVRTLVQALPPEIRLTYFGDPDAPLRPGGSDRVIAAAPMGYSPGLLGKAKVLSALVSPRHAGLPLHFFFTPNKLTSSVLSTLRKLQPRRKMVQSVMSSEGVERHVPLLRPLDAIVVGSDGTRARLRDAGVEDERLHRIYPGVELPAAAVENPARAKRLLYAGDLDPAVADRVLALAPLLRRPEHAGWQLTLACRPKGEGDAEARTRIATELADLVDAGRVELLAEIDDMDALMRESSLQLFLADHVRKKVDLPLVLLEGMARGLGLVALDFSPLSEIFVAAKRHGLEPGRAVPVGDDEALVRAVAAAMAEPASLLAFGEHARQLVLRELSTDRMTRQYAALYGALGGDLGQHE
jgi:hypothetical protein